MPGMKEIPTPTITENDLHHCCCCSPPRKTLIVDVDLYGMPVFVCPRTHMTMRYSHCQASAEWVRDIAPGFTGTYIAGTTIYLPKEYKNRYA